MASTQTISTTLTLVDDRTQKNRECERRSRRRRAAKREQMRLMLDQLERFVVVARILEGNHADCNEFLETTSVCNRRALIRYAQLAKEAQTLRLEQIELQHLLTEHLLSTAAIVNIWTDRFTDHWDAKVAYYSELAHQHYLPWTHEAIRKEMDTARQQVMAFQWSTDKQTTSLGFLGWREKQRFDRVRGSFQFEFHKTFHGYDIKDGTNATWTAFTHRETYLDVLVKHRRLSFFEILQHVAPHVMIIRIHNRCDGVLGDIHAVYLVSRVPTATGYLQYYRTLVCPELIRVLTGPHDLWPDNKIWYQWDRLDGGEMGYTFRNGGSMKSHDINYGQNWMLQAFGCILRIERLVTGVPLVTST